MAIELKVPSVGESITEVVIGEWQVQPGGSVKADDTIVIIETDKVTTELPAPVSGTLIEILKQEGEEAEVGEVIGKMEEGEVATAGDSASANQKKASTEKDQDGDKAKGGETASDERVMPAARRLLDEAGLDAADVEASGPGGRLLKEDVQRHLTLQKTAQQKTAPQAAPSASPAAASPAVASPGGAREQKAVRMTTLRRRIAERLVESQQTSALLTTFNEVDMSAVMNLRKQHQDAFVKKHGIKLGFMSFFVKAVIEGLKEIPALNARIDDGKILYHNYYDIGVAVGGGQGLVVPVIRNAERLSFAGVEQTIGELAGKAKDGSLTADELQGGTFTISNGGIYGSMLSTPIVNPPQSGILGMHNIQQRPVAIDGEVVIRPIMYVALTYDHRLVDGREAVTFLVRVKDCIEDPARMLIEA